MTPYGREFTPASIPIKELLSLGVSEVFPVSLLWSDIDGVCSGVKIGATTFSGQASDGTNLGREIIDERMIEIRAKYVQTLTSGPIMVLRPNYPWTDDMGSPPWSMFDAPWTVYEDGSPTMTNVIPPAYLNAWNRTGDIFTLISTAEWTYEGTGLPVVGSSGAEVPYARVEFELAPGVVEEWSAWTPVGGGLLGDTCIPGGTYSTRVAIEVRLNLPGNASTMGDTMANLEVYFIL